VEIIDHQLSQLNQFLGAQKYRPADAVLRRFVPRADGRLGPESRAAAVWALGRLHEGREVPELVGPLQERMLDMRSKPPEFTQVREMCAVTLGRTKAKEAVPTLRIFYVGKPTEDPVNNASGWALQRLTGEVMPAPQTARKVRLDWFLRPAR
jgi:hypothetical protein